MLCHAASAAAAQTWPPFTLVAGLLLIGARADDDGLFEAIGGRLASLCLAPTALLLVLLGLVAVTTAVLNLDTSVVFLTPVLVHAARHRGVDERAFLYGTVFMSNSASLLLPGSNLTNLIVFRGAARTPDMLPGWLAACAVTAAFTAAAFPLGAAVSSRAASRPRLRPGEGAVCALLAALAILTLRTPALTVLGLGVAATIGGRRPRVGLRMLGLLFSLAVCVGAGARLWSRPDAFLAGRGAWSTAALGAIAALVLNNLPAAALLSAHPPLHPAALLVGLDLGPNLAVTGSLSAVLWLRAARSVGASASLADYTRRGALLVPLTMAAALLAS